MRSVVMSATTTWRPSSQIPAVMFDIVPIHTKNKRVVYISHTPVKSTKCHVSTLSTRHVVDSRDILMPDLTTTYFFWVCAEPDWKNMYSIKNIPDINRMLVLRKRVQIAESNLLLTKID